MPDIDGREAVTTRGGTGAAGPDARRVLRRWGAAAAITLGGAGGVAAGAFLAGIFGGTAAPATTHVLLARDAATPSAALPGGHSSVTATFSSKGGSVHANGSAGDFSGSGGGSVSVTTSPSLTPPSLTPPSLTPPKGLTPPSLPTLPGLTPPKGLTPPSLPTLPGLTPPSGLTPSSGHCVSTPGIPVAATSPVTGSGGLKLTSPEGGVGVTASGTGLNVCAG